MAHDHPNHGHTSHDHSSHDHGAHAHSHGAGHAHAPESFGRGFAIAVTLNTALVVVQLVYGFLANSVALIADAGHNFGDVLGLLLAWGAQALAGRLPTTRYTYGFRSASILAALLNGLILLVATGAIAWEAIRRFSDPGDVAGLTVIVVAAAGIVVNGFSVWLLMPAGKADLNVRGAFLHLLGDAAVSGGVVAAGAVIALTGWSWVDPAASLIISVLIVWSTWGLLSEATRLSLAAVPDRIDPAQVQSYLRGLPAVSEVHDLHIWAMSTTETALTVHLVRPGAALDDAFLDGVCEGLAERFGIRHATVQVEAGGATCRLADADVV